MTACANEKNLLVNVTEGKPHCAVIFMDDGRLIVIPVKRKRLSAGFTQRIRTRFLTKTLRTIVLRDVAKGFNKK